MPLRNRRLPFRRARKTATTLRVGRQSDWLDVTLDNSKIATKEHVLLMNDMENSNQIFLEFMPWMQSIKAVINSECNYILLTFHPNSVELQENDRNKKRFTINLNEKLPSIEPQKISRINYEEGSGIEIVLLTTYLLNQVSVPSIIKEYSKCLLSETEGVCVVTCGFCKAVVTKKK